MKKAPNDKPLFIAAYIKLCAQNGMANTTLADIASKLGYSQQMVNVRFGSKDGLMLEAADYVLAALAKGATITSDEQKFVTQVIAQSTFDSRVGRIFTQHGLIFTLDVQRAGEA